MLVALNLKFKFHFKPINIATKNQFPWKFSRWSSTAKNFLNKLVKISIFYYNFLEKYSYLIINFYNSHHNLDLF